MIQPADIQAAIIGRIKEIFPGEEVYEDLKKELSKIEKQQ